MKRNCPHEKLGKGVQVKSVAHVEEQRPRSTWCVKERVDHRIGYTEEVMEEEVGSGP